LLGNTDAHEVLNQPQPDLWSRASTARSVPLLINIPHAGTELPDALSRRLTPAARQLPDTDWQVDRLLALAQDDGPINLLQARWSRYVVDLNRPPDDRPLYAGEGTGLVPVQTFGGAALYADTPPGAGEIRLRVERYWRPYHDRLAQELDALRQRHGHAVLLDRHSIRSRGPRLFDGALPDLNLGTFDGGSCAPSLQGLIAEWLESATGFSGVINGRFKGGYNTRHYGDPGSGLHAIQLEIAQSSYLDETRPAYWDERRAQPLASRLRELIAALRQWRP